MDAPSGIFNSAPPVLVNGQLAQLQVDANGKLYVSGGPGNGGINANPASPNYQAIAASQANIALVGSGAGAIGDRLDSLTIVPTAASGVGTVTLLDGATTVLVLHNGGTVADLRPIPVPLGIFSKNGAWKITTGAAITVLADGKFT